jgi:hypothetical protein
MTTWITTPFSFTGSSTVFRGQLQGAESLAAGWTLAQLDTTLEDPWAGWSAVTTGSQPAYSWLTPSGCSGWYEVSIGALANTPGSSALIGGAVYVDGALYQEVAMEWADATSTAGASGAIMVPLQGGFDYVQAYIYSSASTSTPAVAGRYPSMEIAWISS